MPARSSVLRLPAELRLELDGRIISQGWAGYDVLAAWLEGEGHRISRSALTRYGRALRAQLYTPGLVHIRLSSARAARERAEAERQGGAADVAATALRLAEAGLQEYLHAQLESGERLDLDDLARVFGMLADGARARGTLSRVQRQEADAAGAKGRSERRGVTPEGAAAMRAAVEGAAK